MWRTKRIDGLMIPIRALCEFSADLKARGWREEAPEFDVQHNGRTLARITAIEGGGIDGEYVRHGPTEYVVVHTISLYGEGSNTYYHEVLLPALIQSKGVLDAVLVWEGGDYIMRLSVCDGEVAEIAIEL
jgi:hypothetical protein